MNIKSSFSYFLFGRACLACHKSNQKLDPYLCPDCKAELIDYGENPLLIGAEYGSNLSDVICLYPMNSLTRALVLAMKYKGMQKIASYLVAHSSVGRGGEGLQILRSWGGGIIEYPPSALRAEQTGGGISPAEKAGLSEGGLIFIPVPVHSARRRERGYNQSERIALDLSLYCNGKLQTQTLKRRIYKPSQTLLGNTERSFNVAGAFEAIPPAKINGEMTEGKGIVGATIGRPLKEGGVIEYPPSALRAEQTGGGKWLADKVSHSEGGVIIVDDVYTTGATTSSCARALTRAGWKNVKVCTLLYEAPVSVATDRAADIKIGWRTE